MNNAEILKDLESRKATLNARIKKLDKENEEILDDTDNLKKNVELLKANREEMVDLKHNLEDCETYESNIKPKLVKINVIQNYLNSGKLSEGEKTIYGIALEKVQEDIQNDYNNYFFDVSNDEKQNDNKPNEMVESRFKEPKKKYDNKIIKNLLVYATTFAILGGLYHGIKTLNNNKDAAKDSTEITMETGDKVKFTDVNNEKQLNDVADAVLANLNTINPNNDFTKEEIIKMVKLINGATVENITFEDVVEVNKRLYTIMNDESVYAANRINDIEVPDEENDKTFNYTEMILDGTRGEKLIQKIENTRNSVIIDPSIENAKKSGNDFMKLIVEAWVLNGGNKEIDSYALETSGMQAFADALFLNTGYMYKNDDVKDLGLSYERKVIIDGNEKTQKFTLVDVLKEVNSAVCKDDGRYVNKQTADINGMYKEAVLKLQK